MVAMTSTDIANRKWTRARSCLLCGYTPCDPHHWPLRKGQGAGDGLLEMVPLCRTHHNLAHEGDHQVLTQLEAAGKVYHDFIRLLHKMVKENHACN